MTDRATDDGSIADIPWAAVYDPAHNIRAFNTIQARGFRAATDVVERLIGLLGQNGAGVDHADPEIPEPQTNGEPAPLGVGRAVSAWQSVATQLVESLRGIPTPSAGAVKLDLHQENSRVLLFLEAVPGEAASTEFWLHNGGPDELGEISLRCSDLLGHDGEVIKASAVSLDPQTMPMPARCSRGVTVRVDVTQAARPGKYRATMLAERHPDAWLPVVLNVLPADL
ncbi:MAG: hypothetical protein QOH60_3209 [Mycobacterium sp.]|nr:hypothetical protein [Mycobacterium sp.]